MTYELFNWFYQLAKIRYTEHHYAKTVGQDKAAKIISIVQDDFLNGTEVRVIQGKTLPEDRQFRFEMAQNDVAAGRISPVDYFEAAGYNNPQQKAKDAELYKINPISAVGITPEEVREAMPQQQQMQGVPPPPEELSTV